MKMIKVSDLKEFASTFFADPVLQLAGIAIAENAPSVDALEVVHGLWEHAEYHGFLRCSQCKDVYIDDTWVADGKWNYCPNCGAKNAGGEPDGK